MTQVYINGRFLCQKMTGQQRFSREIVTSLDNLLDNQQTNFRFTILTPTNRLFDLNLKHISIQEVGRQKGHRWDQFDLLRYSQDGILLSLCGTGPILHRNHIVTLHDAAPFANPKNFTLKFRTAYKIMVPRLARAAQRVITVSNFSKRELSNYCHIDIGKISVVPNGADHILAHEVNNAVLSHYKLLDKPYVLAVGSMSVNKNFGLVLSAFNQLDREDLTLAVVGGQNNSVFKSVDIKNINNLVQLGYVTDAELRTLYQNAICFVLPSHYEGFGIPPLEAMLCNCPVIVSTAPALVETCDSAALYCDPHSALELAKQINALADSPALRAEMCIRGLARANEFTWDRSARLMLDLLQQLD